MVAGQEVSNQALDMGLLVPTAAAAMETLGIERIEAVADRGYFKIEEIEACEAAGVTAYVPKPIRGSAVRENFFSKDEFHDDPEEDVYICPGGATLSPPDRMAARLAARPGIFDRRCESVEHPFGTIKQWMNQGAFLMRRLENVRGGQPDRARLQYQRGHHHRRSSRHDRRREGMIGQNLPCERTKTAPKRPSKAIHRRQAPIPRKSPEKSSPTKGKSAPEPKPAAF